LDSENELYLRQHSLDELEEHISIKVTIRDEKHASEIMSNLRPRLFVFPDFLHLRAMIKRSVLKIHILNPELADKVTMKSREDDVTVI
jgi:hypothetical protein